MKPIRKVNSSNNLFKTRSQLFNQKIFNSKLDEWVLAKDPPSVLGRETIRFLPHNIKFDKQLLERTYNTENTDIITTDAKNEKQ